MKFPKEKKKQNHHHRPSRRARAWWRESSVGRLLGCSNLRNKTKPVRSKGLRAPSNEKKEKKIESSNLTLQVVIHVHAGASDRHAERWGEGFSGAGAGFDSVIWDLGFRGQRWGIWLN
jgi:hypothetical protein